jgi:hypothetical protein
LPAEARSSLCLSALGRGCQLAGDGCVHFLQAIDDGEVDLLTGDIDETPWTRGVMVRIGAAAAADNHGGSTIRRVEPPLGAAEAACIRLLRRVAKALHQLLWGGGCGARLAAGGAQ